LKKISRFIYERHHAVDIGLIGERHVDQAHDFIVGEPLEENRRHVLVFLVGKVLFGSIRPFDGGPDSLPAFIDEFRNPSGRGRLGSGQRLVLVINDHVVFLRLEGGDNLDGTFLVAGELALAVLTATP